MTRFKKDTLGRVFWYMYNGGKEYRLTRYTHHENEFEKGLKYILWERWLYQGNDIEYRHTELARVSSIKEAEKLIKGGV